MNIRNFQAPQSLFENVFWYSMIAIVIALMGVAGFRSYVNEEALSHDKAAYAASMALHVARYTATEPVRNLAKSRVDEILRVHEVSYHATVQHIVSLACGSAAVLAYEAHDDLSGRVRCGSSVTHIVTVERDLAKMPEEPSYDDEMQRYEKSHSSEVDAIEMERPLT